MTRLTDKEREEQKKLIRELYEKYYKKDNAILKVIKARENERAKQRLRGGVVSSAHRE